MIQEAIVKIVDKQDLSYDEAYAVMNEIMSGETTATQMQPFWQLFPLRAPLPRLLKKSLAVPLLCVTMLCPSPLI